MVAYSTGVFWTRECTFSYETAILDLVTLEDWGEEIFLEGVGVNSHLHQSSTGQASKMAASKA